MAIVSSAQITIVDAHEGLSANLTANSFVLPATAAGVVSSYTGAETYLKISEGGVDTTSFWTFYVSAVGTGIAYRDSDDVVDRIGVGTVNGALTGTTGYVKVVSLTTDLSYIDITATKSGLPDITRRFSVARATNGTNGTNGINGTNGTNGTNGLNGTNAVSGFLSNESSVVAADSAGTVGSFSQAGGTFNLYDGITDKTGNASVTYSVFSSSNITISIAATGVYTISAMSADTGSAVLRAVYSGVTIDKIYSIAKSKAGSNGTNGTNGNNGSNARYVNLTTVAQAFTYSSAGALISPANTTLTATAYNTSGTVYYDFLVNGVSQQNGVGNQYTYTPAAYASMPQQIIVNIREGASTGTIVASDVISMIAVKPGTDGTNGTNGTNGSRGSVTGYVSGQTVWSDAVANQYFTTNYSGVKVVGDVITQYGTGFAQTRTWNGTAWNSVTQTVDGNLIVGGSVSAAALVTGALSSDNVLTRGLTVRDNAGNIILASGTALDFSNVGGTTKPAANATKNIVSSGTLASRPTGSDGDFYFATDNNILYQKVSSSWVQSANNYTNTNQLTDGAGLGTKALYENLTGTPAASISNSNISISSNGTLNNAGGGSVTITGLGYSGDLNATRDIVFSTRGITANGNKLTKTGGTGDNWDSDAYTIDSFIGGAYASASPAQTNAYLMFGLNSDPATNGSYASLDYAMYCVSGGALHAYESGVQAAADIGTYAAGDILAVTYDGSNIRYLKNGTILRTVTVSITDRLFFDCSFYTSNAVLNNVRFGPMTSNAWSSIGGANRPADNANNTYIDANGAIQGVSNLAGTVVSNSQITISSGQINGIGTGSGTAVANSNITISGGAIQGIGTGAGTAVANSNISIGSNGTLSGAGGGQVTITGLGYSGDLNATYGAVAGTTLKDSNGRTINDLKLLGNVIDSTTWVENTTGSQTGFSANGVSSTGSNAIIYSDLPSGGRGLIWRATSGSATSTNAEGGWDGTAFNIDATKSYRFSVWIRISGTTPATGNLYLGVQGSSVRYISTSAVEGNPYFLTTARSTLPTNEWLLVVGYVYGSGYASTTNPGASGIYKSSTGEKIVSGTDWKWVVSRTTSSLRTYQYYTSAAGNVQDFWGPRVEMLDGSEPTLSQLLSMGSISARNQLNSSNVSTFIANAAIQNAQIGGDIYSSNYFSSGGTSGWYLNRAGDIIANSGTFRGSLSGANITGATGTFSGNLQAGSVDFASSVGTTTTITTAGWSYITNPANNTKLRITAYGGGGGGGGGGYTSGGYGGYGGANSPQVTNVITLTGGERIQIYVGAGGAGGAYGTAGGAGGTTLVYLGGTTLGAGGTLIFSAPGGNGGATGYTGSPNIQAVYGSGKDTGTLLGYNNNLGSYNGQNGYVYGSGGGIGSVDASNSGSTTTPAGAGTGGQGGGGGSGCAAYVRYTVGGAGGTGKAIVETYDPNGVILRQAFDTLKTEIRAATSFPISLS